MIVLFHEFDIGIHGGYTGGFATSRRRSLCQDWLMLNVVKMTVPTRELKWLNIWGEGFGFTTETQELLASSSSDQILDIY
jgi:hypothetical protein